LLDSYFDDSSSLGSYEESAEVETTNLLESLETKESTPSAENKANNILNLEFLSKDNKSHKSTNKNAPSPLQLSQPPPQPYISRSASSSSSHFQSPLSPSSPNANAVTIGADSPSSIKSMFSPSKRFFARNKNKETTSPSKKNHTISSLSNTSSLKSKNNDKKAMVYNDLMEPPPIFGATSSTLSMNQSPSSTCSRKNSISSVKSGGLSRITSSSSSLNLNAYLTDDTYSLSSMKDPATTEKFKPNTSNNSHQGGTDEDPDEDVDETLILPDHEQSDMKHYSSMSDFLDRI